MVGPSVRLMQLALSYGKVALFLRRGGSKTPCTWLIRSGIYMVDMITARQAIGKFFYAYGFGEILSSVPQNRLGEIIAGLSMKGNQSKKTDFAELNQGFRTTYGHFLSKGKWDEKAVSQKQQEKSFQKAVVS